MLKSQRLSPIFRDLRHKESQNNKFCHSLRNNSQLQSQAVTATAVHSGQHLDRGCDPYSHVNHAVELLWISSAWAPKCRPIPKAMRIKNNNACCWKHTIGKEASSHLSRPSEIGPLSRDRCSNAPIALCFSGNPKLSLLYPLLAPPPPSKNDSTAAKGFCKGEGVSHFIRVFSGHRGHCARLDCKLSGLNNANANVAFFLNAKDLNACPGPKGNPLNRKDFRDAFLNACLFTTQDPSSQPHSGTFHQGPSSPKHVF